MPIKLCGLQAIRPYNPLSIVFLNSKRSRILPSLSFQTSRSTYVTAWLLTELRTEYKLSILCFALTKPLSTSETFTFALFPGSTAILQTASAVQIFILFTGHLSSASSQDEPSALQKGNYSATLFFAFEQIHCTLVVSDSSMCDCSFAQHVFKHPPRWLQRSLVVMYMADAT